MMLLPLTVMQSVPAVRCPKALKVYVPAPAVTVDFTWHVNSGIVPASVVVQLGDAASPEIATEIERCCAMAVFCAKRNRDFTRSALPRSSNVLTSKNLG